ncbi:MAG: error-prone DNA polymerase [Marmoricola sp.]
MGWQNPARPWKELERELSGRSLPRPEPEAPISRKRRRYVAGRDAIVPGVGATPYAELHVHSNYSFLDGASGPDRLVEEAIRLGLTGLALTDHDGFYGTPLFAETAKILKETHPLLTVYGAELSLGLTAPQNGIPDPEGSHLLVLAEGVEGHYRLSAAMTEAHLRGDEKGRPVYDLEELAAQGRDHWVVLTGCRKGMVRQALRHGPEAAGRALDELTALFGHDRVVVELIDHGLPTDSDDNDLLAALAADHGLPVVATNNVHYAKPEDHRLSDAMAAVRARRSLAEMDGWLPPSGAAALRSGEEMARRFARYPGAVARSVELAQQLAFDLQKAKPELPKQATPPGHTPMSYLRELVAVGFASTYAGTDREDEARIRIENELALIEKKDFAGYFTIVHDIVAFARSRGILCQGRGSAASSAVCYALGITAIDSVFYGLPFERFLSEHRDEEPDIDVDFDSDKREQVIQWVYDTYGRHNAAQVANVITYRPKMAVRDAAKALGYSPGQQDAWSKSVDGWHNLVLPDVDPMVVQENPVPRQVVELADELLKAPRHLGIHSGGMVLTDRPIGEVCPIERARMDKRTVLQWDKDACAYMGLVKFDLLGLGMLSALDHMMTMVRDDLGEEWTLQTLPKEEPAVYDMLCRADSIGVFQVESRAQIGTLPRLRPRDFYQLAIEIALIRPGPIQGGAVHPYIRRALGREEVTYVHEDLRRPLERTLGVPLFQEQLMEMAVAIGDCDRDDADLLRRAMGSKRGIERIETIEAKLFAGMARRGIVGDQATAIYKQIQSFANFGFAESHALSFALLVYASSWFKLHYPAAFLAGLLRAQPMGFYSPQSLVGDARRHGVTVLRPDVLRSGVSAGLELLAGVDEARAGLTIVTGLPACVAGDHPAGEYGAPPQRRTEYDEQAPDPTPTHRRDGRFACRLGLDAVTGIGPEVAERIVAARAEEPFRDLIDLMRRTRLTQPQVEALATAGAFACFGLDRRQALWQAGFVEEEGHLIGSTPQVDAPPLPGMDALELTIADLWATRISPDDHPMSHLRELLTAQGIRAVTNLGDVEDGRRIHVAGLITHRQRPGTAGGVTFLNVEDETGMLNVICSEGLWKRYRNVARTSQGMLIRGTIQREDGATNLVADRLARLDQALPDTAGALKARHQSRDFR